MPISNFTAVSCTITDKINYTPCVRDFERYGCGAGFHIVTEKREKQNILKSAIYTLQNIWFFSHASYMPTGIHMESNSKFQFQGMPDKVPAARSRRVYYKVCRTEDVSFQWLPALRVNVLLMPYLTCHCQPRLRNTSSCCLKADITIKLSLSASAWWQDGTSLHNKNCFKDKQ